MSRFSPSEAAFAGLRLIRDRPAAFAVWTLLNLLAVAAIAGLFLAIVGPSLPSFIDAIKSGQAGASPTTAPFLMEQMTTLQVFQRLAQVLSFVALVAINCAVFRAVLDPDRSNFAALRMGPDEFRVGVVKFAFALMWGLGGFVLALGILVVVLGGAAVSGAHVSPTVVGWSIGLSILILVLVGLVVGVRLSLAEVMSFDSGRLQFFDSWALTRNSFWPMLGAYLLAWLMAMMLALGLVIVVGAVLAVVLLGTGANWPGAGDWASLRPVVGPAMLAWLAMGALAGALIRVIMVGPAAYIYAALTDEPASTCPLRQSPAGLVL